MVDSEEARSPVERPIPSLLSAMLRASEGILELLPIATFICDSRGTIRHAVAVWGAAPKFGQTHDEFRESIRFFEMDGTPVARSLVAEVLATASARRRAHRRTCRRHDVGRIGQHRSVARCEG
jgi:hypothetical protein